MTVRLTLSSLDITTTIEEVTVTVPPQNRTIFKIDGRGISDSHRIFSHEVVSLTAKDDETYILDIAGAQHGQYRAIVPFDEYMASHASELTEVHPHGHQAASCQAYLAGKQEHNWMPDNYVGPPVDDRVWEVADEMRKRMLLVVREWEIERGTSVRELLKLDQKRFVARKKSLLKNIRREMEGFIERFEKAGCVFEKRGGLQTVGSGWSSDRDENSEMALENSSTEESNRGSRAVKRMEADKRARTFAAMPSHVRDLFKGLEGADSDIHVL